MTNSTEKETAPTPSIAFKENEIALESTWSFWVDNPSPNSKFEEYHNSLTKINTFSTIEGFWRCYNNLPAVEKLRLKSSYHLTKEGIRPLWEDPAFENGGFWTFRVPKDKTNDLWLELLMATIGEQFGSHLEEINGDEIYGVSVSTRHNDNLIFVWTKLLLSSKEPSLLCEKVASLVPECDFVKPFFNVIKEKKSSMTSDASSTPTPTSTPPPPPSAAISKLTQ